MKIIIKLLSFLIILNFISCYDDKGNYDYEKINDITIEFPDFSWQQIIGETLKVYPKLKYAFNDSTDLKLKFEWSFADRVIGKERQLEWTVDTNVQSDLVLRVTNLDNNLTYMQSKTIRPTSIYTTDKSYLVLSEKNGKSLLSFIQYGEKLDENGNHIRDELGRVILEYKVLEDIYYKENQEELGSQPLFIQEHIADIFPSNGHVVVFQEGGQGSVDLDGLSMKKDILLVESFSGGTYPVDFHPVNAEMMAYTHMIENYDGKIYTKVKETLELFQSGYYIHTPLLFENKEVHGHLIHSERSQAKEFTLLHSVGTPTEPENRLLLIHDLQDSWEDIKISGKVVQLPAPNDGWPENFIPLTDLGDSQVLHIGYVTMDWGTNARYTMFLKNADGTYQYQYFEIEREYDGEGLTYPEITIGDQNREALVNYFITAPIPLEECIFYTLPSPQNEYIFAAHGKEIYLFDRTSPKNGFRHYYTCKANVVEMNGRDYYGTQILIGLDNGGVLLLNTEEAKQLETDQEKFLWESDVNVNLGKIVDITLKVGGYI